MLGQDFNDDDHPVILYAKCFDDVSDQTHT